MATGQRVFWNARCDYETTTFISCFEPKISDKFAQICRPHLFFPSNHRAHALHLSTIPNLSSLSLSSTSHGIYNQTLAKKVHPTFSKFCQICVDVFGGYDRGGPSIEVDSGRGDLWDLPKSMALPVVDIQYRNHLIKAPGNIEETLRYR